VLKGFWGRYYEGAGFNPWQRAVPGRDDYVTYEVSRTTAWSKSDRVP